MAGVTMLTAQDPELLGTAHRSDAMGMLPIWSARARDLVPHLTEQTTEVQGFQLLIEAFRLWELYVPSHPQHAERVDDFFLVVEQAFARAVGARRDWPLPGARRVRARSGDAPFLSLVDHDWHLLGGQRANGVWGLYRGAARRAGLLDSEARQLSDATLAAAQTTPGLDATATRRMLKLAADVMAGGTEPLPTHQSNLLPRGLRATLDEVPIAAHLREMLLKAHPLTHALAQPLDDEDTLDHRRLLEDASDTHPQHRLPLQHAIRCENLLAPVEAVFHWLCAHRGEHLETAVTDLPVDLEALASAHHAFGDSGHYSGATAATRHQRLLTGLDTTSHAGLARFVLAFHAQVAGDRGGSPWLWEEDGHLRGDVDLPAPSERALTVGVAWRNDYYLVPLRRIAAQLEEACP